MKDKILCIGGPLDGHLSDNKGLLFTCLEPRNAHKTGSSVFIPVRRIYRAAILNDYFGTEVGVYIVEGMDIKDALKALINHYCPDPWVFR